MSDQQYFDGLQAEETPSQKNPRQAVKSEYQGAVEIRATIMRVMEPVTERYGRTPEDIVNFCADMRDASQEMIVVILLNTRNRIIDRVMVSLGIQDSSLCHPREVFRPAILKSAAAVVLVHNHPSGDPSPSAEDVRMTRQLVQAGQIIGIKVLDHLIIGRPENGSRGFLSLRESGVAEFDG